MACNIDDPIAESIDTTEVELRTSPDPRVYDPSLVAGRLYELTLEFLPRLDAVEIAALERGEITSQEALDLTDAEHAVLYAEFWELHEASKAIVDGGMLENQRNDNKGPQDKPKGCDEHIADCSFDATLGAGLAGSRFGLYAFVGMAVLLNGRCVCRHCKGYDTVRKACEAIRQ